MRSIFWPLRYRYRGKFWDSSFDYNELSTTDVPPQDMMSILHFVSRGSPSKELIDLTTTQQQVKRTATEANIGKLPDSKKGKPKTVSLATVKGWGYPFLGYKSELIDGTEQVNNPIHAFYFISNAHF